MFHVYDTKFRITGDPISYNHLCKYVIKDAGHEVYSKVSEMKLGEGVIFKDFKIVRVI